MRLGGCVRRNTDNTISPTRFSKSEQTPAQIPKQSCSEVLITKPPITKVGNRLSQNTIPSRKKQFGLLETIDLTNDSPAPAQFVLAGFSFSEPSFVFSSPPASAPTALLSFFSKSFGNFPICEAAFAIFPSETLPTIFAITASPPSSYTRTARPAVDSPAGSPIA